MLGSEYAAFHLLEKRGTQEPTAANILSSRENFKPEIFGGKDYANFFSGAWSSFPFPHSGMPPFKISLDTFSNADNTI